MDRLWLWVGFNAGVVLLLALDLGVLHRKAHRVSLREAAIWSAVWIALSLGFGYGVWHWMGRDAGLMFLAGYLIEKALSVDNIFVFVLIFSALRVPDAQQHRVLFWGVLGALIMRGVMIGAGAYLIERFHWLVYLFGIFLAITGVRLAIKGGHQVHPDRNPAVRLLRRVFPVTTDYHGQRFLVRESARRAATPLLVALVLIEATDLLFALDSIPAIFAVTRDPFLVYTSNVCAILGLRALYFLLAGVVHQFAYLRLGLAVVLVFVGAKMLLIDVYDVPIAVSLIVIASILAASIAASLAFPGAGADTRRAVH